MGYGKFVVTEDKPVKIYQIKPAENGKQKFVLQAYIGKDQDGQSKYKFLNCMTDTQDVMAALEDLREKDFVAMTSDVGGFVGREGTILDTYYVTELVKAKNPFSSGGGNRGGGNRNGSQRSAPQATRSTAPAKHQTAADDEYPF